MGLDPVVGVNEEDKVPPRLLHAQIAGGGDTAVGFMKDPDPVVLAGVIVTQGAAAVGRAIVDEKELPVGKGLGQDGVHALG